MSGNNADEKRRLGVAVRRGRTAIDTDAAPSEATVETPTASAAPPASGRSRSRFDEKRRSTGVNHEQGRTELDADAAPSATDVEVPSGNETRRADDSRPILPPRRRR